jgi:hypothetical protein
VPEARNFLKCEEEAAEGRVECRRDTRGDTGSNEVPLVFATAEVLEDAKVEAHRRGVHARNSAADDGAHVNYGAFRANREPCSNAEGTRPELDNEREHVQDLHVAEFQPQFGAIRPRMRQ